MKANKYTPAGEEPENMTLQQLSYFCVLADILHFTKASEQLHVTQPSLSYSIAKLEKDMGVPLFRKTGKKLALTQYGEVFLPYARQALETLEFGARKVESLRAPAQGSINLGYVYSVSYDFFPTLISNFMSIDGNREVTFQFTQGVKDDLLQKLAAGHLDLAIAGSYDAPGVQKATLLSQEIYLIMPKTNPLSARETLSISELRGQTFIFPKPCSGLREVLDRAFAEAGVIPHIAFEAEECNAMAAFRRSAPAPRHRPAVDAQPRPLSARRALQKVRARTKLAERRKRRRIALFHKKHQPESPRRTPQRLSGFFAPAHWARKALLKLKNNSKNYLSKPA